MNETLLSNITNRHEPVIYPFAWREEITGTHQQVLKTYEGECAFENVEQALSSFNGDRLQRVARDADLLIRSLAHPQAQERGACEFSGDILPDAYFLDTRKLPFILAADTQMGLIYGIQSLKQLQRDQEWLSAAVWDAPALPIRGMHAFLPARENIPFFKRWINLLAFLKYNTLFLEIGGGMEYKRHPEINKAWRRFTDEVKAMGGESRFTQIAHSNANAMHIDLAGGQSLTQDEVRDLVVYARSCGVDVVPEIQSLSHSYYLCLAHPEIAENKEHRYPDTYCPFHPLTYTLLFDVMDEIREVVEPRMVHIGHDEWFQIACCERCQDKSPASILKYDINRICGYLFKHHIQCAIWGDKLMNIITGGKEYGGRDMPQKVIRGKTYPAIELLSNDLVFQDVLILDWYWGLDGKSQEYFHRYGFKQIFGNLLPLALAANRLRRPGVLGGEVSSWCLAAEKNYAIHGIVQNVLFAANALWWKNYTDHEKAITYQQLKRVMPIVRECLSGQKRIQGTWQTVSDAPPEVFANSDLSQDHCPSPRCVTLNRKIKALRLIHTAGAAPNDQTHWNDSSLDSYTLGEYRIVTKKHRYCLPVVYRLNILTKFDHPLLHGAPYLLYGADATEESMDPWGCPVRSHGYEWVNPHPEDVVLTVEVNGDIRLIKIEGIE